MEETLPLTLSVAIAANVCYLLYQPHAVPLPYISAPFVLPPPASPDPAAYPCTRTTYLVWLLPLQPPPQRRSRRMSQTRRWPLRAARSSGGARNPRGATTTTMRRPHSPRASAPDTIHRRCPRASALPRRPSRPHRLRLSTPHQRPLQRHRRGRPQPPAAPTVSPKPCRVRRGAPRPRRPRAKLAGTVERHC